jgi:hypothetical protein
LPEFLAPKIKNDPADLKLVSNPNTIRAVKGNITVRLTLHKLKFINPKGIVSELDEIPDDAWIKTKTSYLLPLQ